MISDPRNLEFVFKNEAIFAKGDFMKKPLWDLFGECVAAGCVAASSVASRIKNQKINNMRGRETDDAQP